MKMKIHSWLSTGQALKAFLLIAVVMTANKMQAQSIDPFVVNSSGSHGTSSGSQLSWNVGETVILVPSPGGLLSAGFLFGLQQATGVKEAAQRPGPYIIFPNPTDHYLHLDFSMTGLELIQIYDLEGRRITGFKCQDGILDVSELSDGLYLLYLSFDHDPYPVKLKFIKAGK